jgi:LysM repeat protein
MLIFRKTILIISIITSGNFLFALNPIYVEISECTKEYKYVYTEPNDVSANYYTYHFSLNEFETIILEASSFQNKIISSNSTIAQNRLTCGSDLQHKLSSNIIESFHKGDQMIYLLKPNDTSFEVLNVTDVTYQVYLSADNFTRILSGSYGFDYDTKGTENTLSNVILKDQSDIKFINKTKVGCVDKIAFEFRSETYSESSNVEYLIGIGLFKQYSKHMKHQLISIDNQPLSTYITEFCLANKTGSAIITTKSVNKPSEQNAPQKEIAPLNTSDIIIIESLEEFTEGQLYLNTNNGPKNSADVYKSSPVNRNNHGSKLHIVESGETLYSISKKYNMTVIQLKQINHLEENNIEIGQELIIRK